MDKDQIVEWLSKNLSLDSNMIYDGMGNTMGAEIYIEIFHDKKQITLAKTQIYFD